MSDQETKVKVLELWQELKVLVDSTELDVMKNVNGNASAGVRARHGLRSISKKAQAISKITLEADKQRKASGKDEVDG